MRGRPVLVGAVRVMVNQADDPRRAARQGQVAVARAAVPGRLLFLRRNH